MFVPLLLSASIWFGLDDHASVSAYAVRMSTGEVLVDESSDKSLVPGSCMKVITTAAALEILGPEYRFTTLLERDGSIDEAGTLHGNIYIHGDGDPCLGSDRIAPSLDYVNQVGAWAEAIMQLGIKKIEGTIVGDATKWESSLAVPSWLWEDTGNYYGAGACALSFNENCYMLFFRPGDAVGKPAAVIKTEPFLPKLELQNYVKTGPKGSGDCACIYGMEYNWLQSARGTVPTGVDEFSIKGAIPNPPEFCASALAHQLRHRGIDVGTESLAEKPARVIFHATYSPTVSQIVFWTNQNSINLYAEHFLKKMGEVVFNEGSMASGVRAVEAFWRRNGINLEGFYMADGSGLSRKNLVTAKQFVAILVAASKSPHFKELFTSLPERQGIKLKSGSMSQVRAYVGYKGDVAFAIMVNHYLGSDLNSKMDHVLRDLLNNMD